MNLDFRQYQYSEESRQNSLPLELCNDFHPLLSVVNEMTVKDADKPPPPPDNQSEVKPKEVTDPLSSDPISDPLSDPLSSLAFDDPLSSMVDPLSNPGGPMDSSNPSDRGRTTSIEDAQVMAAQKFEDELETPWVIKKQQILKTYQVTSLKVSADFMKDEDNREEGKSLKSVDRTKKRLDALEDKEGGGEMMELTQKEYVEQLTRYHEELQRAWKAGERVLSIKIVIKCTRLLADTSVVQFYPSVFIMVTEVLDTFGEIVYDRIMGKAEEDEDRDRREREEEEKERKEGKKSKKKKKKKKPHLPPNWTTEDININAKETCRNWFYKISSIRELLPRIYMEMCLLKCYRFLSTDEYPQVLSRLASMIRGVGDPLVSVFAQCYLARCGGGVCREEQGYATTMVYDYLYGFKEYETEKFAASLNRMGVSLEEYLHLQSPAVEWIFKCVGRKAPKSVFTTTLKHYRDYSSNSMVLKHIIDCFDPKHYAPNAAAMVSLVKMAKPSKVGMIGVFETIAERFIQSPPPEEQRMLVLNEVWKVVTKCDDLKTYISCSTAWLEVVLHHYSSLELNVLLRDVVKHLVVAEQEGQVEGIQKDLEPLVKLLVHHCYDFNGVILKSGELLAILDKFKESRKAEHCKELLESFAKHSDETSDPVLINTLFEVSRTLHDSIDSLSPEGEQRHCASLISGFIEKINYGKDFERQLNTYVECRAGFCNLDDVKTRLVLCVCKLAMQTLNLMKGKHNKKTAAFVKGCLAFNHITIPSIEDAKIRLDLLVTCGLVGLKNMCLPQTDTFLKQAIVIVPEVAGGNGGADMIAWVGTFCSLLVVVPGSPDLGPFYLMNGLQKALGKWSEEEEGGNAAVSSMMKASKKFAKSKCLLLMLGTCSSWAQKKLPYAIPGVDSNDTLYGGSAGYMEELKQLSEGIVGEVVADIEAMEGESSMKDELVLGLLDCLIEFFQGPSADKMTKSLAKKMMKREQEAGLDKNKRWFMKIKQRLGLQAGQ